MGYGTGSGFHVEPERVRRIGVYLDEVAELMTALQPLGDATAAAGGGGVAGGAMSSFGRRLQDALGELGTELHGDADRLGVMAGRYREAEDRVRTMYQCPVPVSTAPMDLRAISR